MQIMQRTQMLEAVIVRRYQDFKRVYSDNVVSRDRLHASSLTCRAGHFVVSIVIELNRGTRPSSLHCIKCYAVYLSFVMHLACVDIHSPPFPVAKGMRTSP